jgi:hypothetical protein
MAWNEVQLTPALVAANEHGRIQDRFEYFFHKLNAPRDMGMFSDQQPGQDLHLYFLLPAGDVSEAFLRVSDARPVGSRRIVFRPT